MTTPKRRTSDRLASTYTHERPQLGELTAEEHSSLIDALRVALAGPHRRAGDESRWRDMLTRLGATWGPAR
jgi:hypothetical protein